MKTYLKRTLGLCLMLAMVFGFVFGINATNLNQNANAEAQYIADKYFYLQLDPISKAFYKAFEDMESSGLFKKSESLDLSKYLTQEQLKSHVQGSSTLAFCFQKARDAYDADNSVFYVDFEKITFRTGKQNNSYVALICSGNYENYYINGINNEADCNNAISAVKSKVTEIANKANAHSDIKSKIQVVHDEIVNSTEYLYADQAGEDGIYVHNLYGTLIKGKSVCEGYAKSFKLICDNLKINSVYVVGVAKNSKNQLDLHAWNNVEVDGKWYAVDTTWDDPVGGSLTQTYFLNGSRIFNANHYAGRTFSPNGFSFGFPILSNENYGISEDISGLKVISTEMIDKDGDYYTLFKVAYEGMGPRALAKLGLTFVQKTYLSSTGEWSGWFAYDEGRFEGVFDNDYFLELFIYNQKYTQFAVINLPLPLPNTEYLEVPDENIVALSDIYENRFEGMYVPPPYIKDATPTVQMALLPDETYEVVCTYTDDLKIAEGATEYSIRFECSKEGAIEKTKIENFVWNESKRNQISFTFTPSAMFAHQTAIYSFYLVNLVGVKSDKTPMPLNYVTQRPTITNYFCPFRGPQASISTTAQPVLIANEDLSQTNWVDSDNNQVDKDLMYNMVMVASTPDENKQAQIEDLVAQETNNNGKISSTYDIKISLCSKEIQLKDNYVYLMLGFPEGLDSTSIGVEYTIYHFKEDANGNLIPEIIPCVVTEYGLVAEVRSFSPFAVVVTDKQPEPAQTKSVFVNNSNGGTVSKNGIVTVQEQETFELSINSSTNYEIESIFVNNKSIEINNVETETLQLDYADLQENNNIKINYVTKALKQIEREQGIENITPNLNVIKDNVLPKAPVFTVNLLDKQIIKFGNEIVLSVKANAEDNGLITYAWFKDGKIIEGATESTLTISNATKEDIGSYKVVVSNTLNGNHIEQSSVICKVESSSIFTKDILIIMIVAAAMIALYISRFIFKKIKLARITK